MKPEQEFSSRDVSIRIKPISCGSILAANSAMITQQTIGPFGVMRPITVY